jgi:outer membrane protein OmpA-like peptidoglycan-associated protein
VKFAVVSFLALCFVACGSESASAPTPAAPAAPACPPIAVAPPVEKLSPVAVVEDRQAKTAPAEPPPVETAYPNRQSFEALDRLPLTLHVKHEGKTSVVTLASDDFFDPGSATLRDASDLRLVPVATALRQQSGRKITIRGYTDALGDPAENKRLARDRAAALRDALVARGVDADALRVEGLGAEHPVGDNGSPYGRAENRRIELVIRPERVNLP